MLFNKPLSFTRITTSRMEYFDSRPLYRDPVTFVHVSENPLKPQITSSIPPPPLSPRAPILFNHQNTVETPYATTFSKRPDLLSDHSFKIPDLFLQN